MPKQYERMYYFISFFQSLSFSFFFASYTIFFLTRGMNLADIGILASIAMLFIVALEVPTGAFADIYGRKTSIIIGFVMASFAAMMFYASFGFWQFAVAQALAGISTVFVSGALDAWMVDSMKHSEASVKIGDIFAKGMQLSQMGMIFGSLSGAYIADIDIALPWLASSLFCGILAVICLLKMKEDYELDRKRKIGELKNVIVNGIKFSIRKKDILYVVLFTSIIFCASKSLDIQWNIVFRHDFHLDIKYLGWIFAGFSIFMIIGAQISMYLMRRIEVDRRLIAISQTLTAAGTIMASLMMGLFHVAGGLFIQEIGRGAMGPLEQLYLNKEGRIPSSMRATILSFNSMMLGVGGAIGFITSGYIANLYSISFAWMVSGTLMVLSIVIFMSLKNGK